MPKETAANAITSIVAKIAEEMIVVISSKNHTEVYKYLKIYLC